MPPRSSAPAARQERDRLAQMVRLLTELGSSAALLTALLYYFGWARSEAQARAFGADASAFAMSTQDFVLRSIGGLFPVVFVALLLWLLALRVHRRVMAALPGRPRWLRILVMLLRLSWAVALLLAALLLFLVPALGDAILPLLIGFGIAGTAYGTTLRRRMAGRKGLTVAALALIAALLAVSAFWATERFAREVGEAQAADLKANLPWRLSPVTVFSAAQLHLSGVPATELPASDVPGSYRYRYDGLFFLQSSGGKYFFLTEGWDRGQGRLVVLPDTHAIRVEYGR